MMARTRQKLLGLMRTVLSYYVTNGLVVALGFGAIVPLLTWLAGGTAGAVAGLAVVCCIPPDVAAPRRGKLRVMLPVPLLATPLFFGVQMLAHNPVHLGILLLTATFFLFLGMAWGKSGLPVAVSLLMALFFSMAAPDLPAGQDVLRAALHLSMFFLLGSALYVLYSLAANHLLNNRYRVLYLANTLLSMAALMQAQARQFTATATGQITQQLQTGALLRLHATLAETLQSTRDMVLETPDTPARQVLADMLLQLLELRDDLLACETHLDRLPARSAHMHEMSGLRLVFESLAAEMAQLADCMLLGRKPPAITDLRPALHGVLSTGESTGEEDAAFSEIAQELATRIGCVNDRVLHLHALARRECAPDLEVIRNSWQMFIRPVTWAIRPMLTLWRWDAPPLRHAIRATLAVATGYGISLVMPWQAHAYWILLTIVLVMRGSLSQTLQRRNDRVAGTVLGCLLVVALLALKVPPWLLLLCTTLSQGLAHGFAPRNYMITSVAGTIVALLQTHMLNNSDTSLALMERLLDTVIGAAIAWIYSYVLPSWERGQIIAMLRRCLRAQARFGDMSLHLDHLQAVDNTPELQWRLARREVYDSISALAQATQRALAEPRAVRPPLVPLERFQVLGYQMLTLLTRIKSAIMQRGPEPDPQPLQETLDASAQKISDLLLHPEISEQDIHLRAQGKNRISPTQAADSDSTAAGNSDLWLLQQLDAAADVAARIRAESRVIRRDLRLALARKRAQEMALRELRKKARHALGVPDARVVVADIRPDVPEQLPDAPQATASPAGQAHNSGGVNNPGGEKL